MTEKNHI